MKVYRVYHSYHETSESGTKENGIYSTEEKARERAIEVAQKISLPDTEITVGDGFVSFGSWDTTYINWDEYEVDKDIDMDFNGYT